MNYIALWRHDGGSFITIVDKNHHAYGTFFYCLKPEDEEKIYEVKARELLYNEDRDITLIPLGSPKKGWRIENLASFISSETNSYFILYADIDRDRLKDKVPLYHISNLMDVPIYTVINLDP